MACLVEFNNESFIADGFVNAALLSAGKYKGAIYEVSGERHCATVAAENGDKAQALFNAAFQRRKDSAVWFQLVNVARAPYPFCRTPGMCAGKGYCPADIACND